MTMTGKCVFVLVAVLAAIAAHADPLKISRPNIVLVMSDDHRNGVTHLIIKFK